MKTVSIVIPCHNYGKYLAESIESALNQTYPAIEVAVVDDESVDDSRDVAVKYPVKYYRSTHVGARTPASAHNFGLKVCGGDFIIFLGADDKLEPDYVSRCIQRFACGSNIGFVWTGCQEFGLSNRLRVPRKQVLKGKFSGFINPGGQLGAMLVPRKVYGVVGGYDVNLDGFEDWDWVIRCLNAGYTGLSVPDPLHHVRVHGVSASSSLSRDNVISEMYRKHALMKPVSYIQRSIEYVRRKTGF